jgi:beta-ribofuranosylaminobenzene 5'-phosphate synthase
VNPGRDHMLTLIHKQLIPALKNRDWRRWDSHIGQYGALAGKIFERVQGGVYRSRSIQRIIETCKSLGYDGAAQSSWGPTVALVLQDLEEAQGVSEELSDRLPGVRVRLTEAKNRGSSVAVLAGR